MKPRPFLLLTLLLLPLSLSAQEKDTLVVSGMQDVPVVHTAGASVPTLYRPYRTISGGDIRKGKDKVSKAALSRNTEEYAVGEIPLSEGVSPTGGRQYSIPIPTAPGWSLAPELALSYDSQCGLGDAGQGWRITGLSVITVRSANEHYDGADKPFLYNSPDVLYALDGVPLVPSETGGTALAGYTLETARGRILVKPHTSSGTTNPALWFDVLYPDGSSATFGTADYGTLWNSYPITERRDRFGNRITYSYSFLDGRRYISHVDYGHDLNCHVDFSWELLPHCVTDTWIAGLNSYTGRRIHSISSYDGSSALGHMNLTYDDGGPVNHLIRVDESSGSSSLPPLEFSYGEDVDGSGSAFTRDWSIVLDRWYGSGTEVRYIRGKFIPGLFSDGIIMVPQFNPYAVLEHKVKWFTRYYKYGSDLPAATQILCHPDLDYFASSSGSSFVVGSGLEFIDAADVDCDGTDELITVNEQSASGTSTTFTVNVRRFTALGAPTIVRTFSVLVNSCASNPCYDNPARCHFLLGDFRGDGQTMLLIMSNEDSRFCLVDLNAGSKVFESALYDVDDTEAMLTFVADPEGCGCDELCHVTGSALDVYHLDGQSSGSSFTLRRSIGGVGSSSLCREPNYTISGRVQDVPVVIHRADLVGDGYCDLVAQTDESYLSSQGCSSTNTFNIARLHGGAFNTATVALDNRSDGDDVMLMDIDHDGLPDLLHRHGDVLSVLPNVFGTITSPACPDTLHLPQGCDLVPYNMCSSNAMSDLLAISGQIIYRYSYRTDRSRANLLTSCTDSRGIIHNNEYDDISQRESVTYSDDWSRSYSAPDGFLRYRVPLKVLSSGTQICGFDVVGDNTYSYRDLVFNCRGLGLCGFGYVTDTDGCRMRRSSVTYLPEKSGVISGTESRLTNGTLFATAEYQWDDHTRPYAGQTPRLTGTTSSDLLSGVQEVATFSYDSRDFPTGIVRQRTAFSGSTPSHTHSTVTSVTYSHREDASLYLLGSPASKSVTETDSASPGSSVTESEQTAYVSSTQLPSSVTTYRSVDSSPPQKASQTRFTYDSCGHVTSMLSAPYSATVFRGSTYTWDNHGRYITSETDALGLTTQYGSYDVHSGKPGRVTDHLGGVTLSGFDDLGRVVSETRPDGSTVQLAYSWGGEGLYTLTTSPSGGPVTTTHYDALGRVVRTEEERFDGTALKSDTRYNADGSVSMTSLPFKGSSPSLWTTFTYDSYGRLTRRQEPSGRIASRSYAGLTTVETEDGIAHTRVHGPSGELLSATDIGGTITYAYDPAGNITRLTAPGGTATTFSYDVFGRRTGLIDPSRGSRTTSRTDYADGTARTVDTGPNGNVTRQYDAFGRLVTEEYTDGFGEPAGTSSWTYDSDGMLIRMEHSGGSSTGYDYDGLGRLSAVCDTVPDGRWFRQSFNFDGCGRILSTAFSSEEGAITAEHYTYSHGHHCATRLTDSSLVWRLDSENGLGLPASAATGVLTRGYSFTSTGLPARRTLGSLMDSRWNYDGATGNLLSRTDATRNITETFTYDALGRLSSMDGRAVTRATNGNLLEIEDLGTWSYQEPEDPYLATGFAPLDSLKYWPWDGEMYDALDRPIVIEHGSDWSDTLLVVTSLDYSAGGVRTRMRMGNGADDALLTRYYMGDGRYEVEERDAAVAKGDSLTVRHLWLDGNPYDSPAVLEKKGSGPWTLIAVGRDVQGSITHLADASTGALLEEYSYDAWGWMRDPSDHRHWFDYGLPDPALRVSRGYTGHEHIPGTPLVNANARLYDPIWCSFRIYDPQFQSPDFTQGLNPYTYCLGNPLKYTDQSGEIAITSSIVVGLLFSAAIGGFTGVIYGADYAHKQGLTGKEWNRYVLNSGLIGMLAGGISATVGVGVGAAVAAKGIGGFLLGAATGGAAGGVAGGLISGFSSLFDKETFLKGQPKIEPENFDPLPELDFSVVGEELK